MSHAVVIGPPKTDAGRRGVDLDADTIAVLRAWRAAQASERFAWGPAYVDSGLVFTTEDGRLLHPERATTTFLRLQEQAGSGASASTI